MKKISFTLFLLLSFTFLSPLAYSKTCKEKKDVLRDRLKKCKSNSCKNRFKREIANFKCSDVSSENSNNNSSQENNCQKRKKDLIAKRKKCKNSKCKNKFNKIIQKINCSSSDNGSNEGSGTGSNDNCQKRKKDLIAKRKKCKNSKCKNKFNKIIQKIDCSSSDNGNNEGSGTGSSDNCQKRKKDLIAKRKKCKNSKCKNKFNKIIQKIDCSSNDNGSNEGSGTGSNDNCQKRKKDLIAKRKKCKNSKCKNKFNKIIQKIDCSNNNENGNNDENGNLAACKKKKKSLIAKRKKCKNSKCKKKFSKLIKKNSCKGSEVKGGDCKFLVKLWETKEPLEEEGRPDSTAKIDGNIAYRESRKGINDFVQGANSYNYRPSKNAQNAGARHGQISGPFKGQPDVGAYEAGKPFPNVGANLPKYGVRPTNDTRRARIGGSAGFSPSRAHWVDQARNDQDDL